eukprot:SAG31_NODE_7422_length_1692_cov_4.387947_2_plen_178_part_00
MCGRVHTSHFVVPRLLFCCPLPNNMLQVIYLAVVCATIQMIILSWKQMCRTLPLPWGTNVYHNDDVPISICPGTCTRQYPCTRNDSVIRRTILLTKRREAWRRRLLAKLRKSEADVVSCTYASVLTTVIAYLTSSFTQNWPAVCGWYNRHGCWSCSASRRTTFVPYSSRLTAAMRIK